MRPASGRPHDDPVVAIDALLGPAGAAPLWVGFSGGLDSSVLLHATCAARAARGEPAPHAIHVHHGLQPDADAWALHCTNEALRWGVTLRVSRVRVADAGSLEATARDARYAVFRELLATPDAALLLAHHRDDQVETVLLRLLQGRGLYGMPRVRPLGRGRVLRPLLGMARADLMAYARQHQLTWVDDPSNAMLAADRNFLRQSVLPLLRTRFPELDARVLAVAAAAGAARSAEPEPDRLAVVALLDLTLDPACERLAQWLLAHGQALPTRRALRSFVAQLGAADDRQPMLVGRGYRLYRYANLVWRVAAPPPLEARYDLGQGGQLCLPHGVLEIEPVGEGASGDVEAAMSEDRVPDDLVFAEPPFTVTFRRGGERLRARGRTRALKHELQARAIAPWLRDRWPLVHDAHGLCAVPGVLVRDALPQGAGVRYRLRWRPH
ncbi:MAG: tRNA lysidine(34) synthetase TilS [Gammaproteobacteria bacterium]